MLELLKRDAFIESISKIDKMTPLRVAIAFGNIECCFILLQAGAQVLENISDYGQIPPTSKEMISNEIDSRRLKCTAFHSFVNSHIEHRPYKDTIYAICFPSGYSSVTLPKVGWKRANEMKQELYFKEITYNLHLSIAKIYSKGKDRSIIDHIASNNNKTFILMKLLTIELKEYLFKESYYDLFIYDS
jgi:hypothetical protein